MPLFTVVAVVDSHLHFDFSAGMINFTFVIKTNHRLSSLIVKRTSKYSSQGNIVKIFVYKHCFLKKCPAS